MNIPELTPFMAAMRMVKTEYAAEKPEIYKMLMAVLHDYNPHLGTGHYKKVRATTRFLEVPNENSDKGQI